MSRLFHIVRSLISKKTLSLSYSLARVNFKLRNEGSYLGIFWYLLNPLALFATILFVKQNAFSEVEISFYPLYLLVGLITLSYLNRIIIMSTDVIRNNSSFIKSIQIPTEVLVVSTSMHVLMLHVFEVLILTVLALYMGIPILNIALYVFATGLLTIFLLGLSFLFATFGVFVTDITNMWSVASQLLFFITPTFYVLHATSLLYIVNMYNPIYYFMTLSRDVLIKGSAPLGIMYIACVLSSISLCVGLLVFSKYQRRFAEYV